MTVIWLLVWLGNDTPAVVAWNPWLIALVVCGGLDVLGVIANRRGDQP